MKSIGRLSFIGLLFLFSSIACSVEVDDDLQNIFEAIVEKKWDVSMELLLAKPEEEAEVNLLWALWYDDRDNPRYDPIKSTKSLEIATKLGSRDAQLLLVGRYLFSSDPKVTNYFAGVEVGRDLVQFYEGKIDSGEDLNGELHRIVGKFYIFGAGVNKDIDHGMTLVRKAADLGDVEAKEMLRDGGL